MKKSVLIDRVIAIAVCLIVPVLTYAQPDPPNDTPIDGGVTLLLAAGVGYGVKKYRDSRKGRESVAGSQESEEK